MGTAPRQRSRTTLFVHLKEMGLYIFTLPFYYITSPETASGMKRRYAISIVTCSLTYGDFPLDPCLHINRKSCFRRARPEGTGGSRVGAQRKFVPLITLDFNLQWRSFSVINCDNWHGDLVRTFETRPFKRIINGAPRGRWLIVRLYFLNCQITVILWFQRNLMLLITDGMFAEWKAVFVIIEPLSYPTKHASNKCRLNLHHFY